MLQKYILIGWFCFYLTAISMAQRFNFTNVSETDKIESQLIDITQDRYGNLWMVGLLGQFFYYDGTETQTFSLPPELFTNKIFRIVVDSSDLIWLLTDRGLFSFNGSGFKQIPIPGTMELNYETQMCADRADKIWIMDHLGKVGYTNGNKIVSYEHPAFSPDSKVLSMKVDQSGNVYFLQNNGLLLQVENNNTRNISKEEWRGELILGFDSTHGNHVTITNKRVIIQRNKELIKIYKLKYELDKIDQLIVDARFNIWVLREGKLFKVSEEEVIPINEANGLTNNRIVRIFKDRSSELWVLTDAKGTFKFDQQPFRQFIINEEPIVSSILPLNDQSTILGTYGKGLFLISNSDEIVRIKTNTALDDDVILSILQAGNNFLVGTHGDGLYELQPGVSNSKWKAKKATQPTEIKYIRSMKVVGDSILLGTKAGFFLGKNYKWQNLLKSDLIVNCFYLMDSETIIIGAASGLFKLANHKLSSIENDRYQSTGINVIKRDPFDNIWIASNKNEIQIYDSHLSRKTSIILPVVYQGIFGIEFIDSSTAIIGVGGAQAQIVRIKFSPKYEIISYTTFDATDGFQKTDLVSGATVRSEDGTIWIGSTRGAFQFNPDLSASRSQNPVSYIRRIKLVNPDANIYEYATRSSGFFQIPVELKLPHNLNSLLFNYRANRLQSIGNLRYQFKMEGLDATWSDWSSQEQVIYSNLGSGDFSFKVRAMNADGHVGPITEYAFTISPAIWQTWWFYTFGLLMVILLVVLLNRFLYVLRLKAYNQQEKRKQAETQKIRQQMSMDFHDELGNKLANVMSYAAVLKSKSHNAELNEALNYIEASANEIFHQTKDFLWTLDVQSNNLFQVLVYLRDFAAKLFERNQIQFDFQSSLPLETFDLPLPEGYNRQMVMLFKEVMTNILRHSKCKTVLFSVNEIKKGMLLIVMEDDGHGIGDDDLKGHGQRNMRQRADKIGAVLKVERSDSGGTKVSLEMCLNFIKPMGNDI